MAKKIGVRVYLDGASQFNNDIKKIDTNLRQLRSEMKQNSEQFKSSQNSAEALSAKSQTLNKQYEEASKKIQIYSQRMEELRRARENDEKNLEEYNAALRIEVEKLTEIEKTQGKNSEAYKQQAEKVSGLEQAIQKTTSSIESLDIKETQLQTSINNTTAEQIKYGAELTQTNAYLEEAKESTDKCAESIDEYGRDVSEADKQTEKLNTTIDNIRRNEAFEALGEAAEKTLEALIDCAETAETFEASIAKVQSIAQVSKSELGSMSSEIRRVAMEMGYGANEVAEATYQAISASVDAAEAVGFVEDTTKLARAGFTEVTTAVDVLTTAVNAYGKEANTTAHIADDLITTQNLGKTTVDELAQSMGTIIPTASAYGVSLDQLSAAYVLLTKQGINTANATTYLRGMLNELGDSGSDVSDILYDLTGHSFGELTKMGYTLGDVLQMLGDSVDGNTESFANLFENIRAGQGALAIFNQGADVFNDTLNIMEHNAGATERAFEIMADTAVMTNQRFEASIENLKIEIGESLSPTIESLKKLGIDAIDTIAEFVKQHPTVVGAIAGVTVGVTAATVALTGLATAVAVLKAAFGDMTGVIGLAVAGVAGLGGGLAGAALAASKVSDEMSELTGKYQEQIDASDSLNKTVSDYIEDSKTQGEFADKLATKIENLNSKEKLSATEKRELREAVRDLNSIYPELNLAINEQTGHLIDNTGEWRKNMEAMQAAADAQFALEKTGEITAQLSKNDYELFEIEQQLKEVREDRQRVELEYISLQERENELNGNEVQRKEELFQIGNDLINQEDSLIEKKKEYAAQNEELNGSLSTLNSYMEKNAELAGQEGDAVNDLTDDLGVAAPSARELADAQDAIEKAVDAASNAVSDQIGIFEEWKKESDLSLADMEARWKQQTEGINQYKDDLSYLKTVIDTETDPAIVNLAQNMVSMGVDSSAEIHNFVEGLKQINGNKDAMTELAETWQKHLDAIQSAEGLYEGIQLQNEGYTKQAKSLFDLYYSDSEAAQQEYNGNMVELVTQGVSDQAKAIETTAPEVENATKEMATNVVTAAQTELGMNSGKSSKFYEIGQGISKSMAEGISSEESGIKSAMQKALQNAADGIDASGVASKISNKISSAINVSSITSAVDARINNNVQKSGNVWK